MLSVVMLRILFDKNVPWPLIRHLSGYQVTTAERVGWGQISNGILISRAEAAGYDIMVTCDQNIQYQQNLSGRRISMVVLSSNFWPNIKINVADVLAAVARSSPGSFENVDIIPTLRHRHPGDTVL